MPKTETHSVRTAPALWAAAKRRADSDGVQMNTVLTELLEGYGRGLVNLPKVTKTYDPPLGGTGDRHVAAVA